jgi:DNA-binding NarL/FixJ family response regulator
MPRSPLIRVAVLDPHPAVRAGVEAVLTAQHDLAPAGSAAGEQELWPLLNRSRPDVLLIDQPPRSGDGLVICRRVKGALLAPRVVLCAADAGPALIVPAALAEADALVDKAADLRELLAAIRAVASGARPRPRITPRLQAQAAARLGHRDRAIFAMRLAGTTPRDIAATVGLSGRALDARLTAIVAALGRGEDAADPGPDLVAQALGDVA